MHAIKIGTCSEFVNKLAAGLRVRRLRCSNFLRAGVSLSDRTSGIVATVTAWVKMQDTIRGLALVDFQAQSTAPTDLCIHFVLLTKNPDHFREISWLHDIDWLQAGVRLIRWTDEEYGAVWTRRAWLEPHYEVEFSFAFTTRAAVFSLDPTTARTRSKGWRILYDPKGLLKRLTTAVACRRPSR
jgi:hypothetical protein